MERRQCSVLMIGAQLVLLAWIGGCAKVICEPGETQACHCPGGDLVGVQVCDDDGKGWGNCACPDGDDDDAADDDDATSGDDDATGDDDDATGDDDDATGDDDDTTEACAHLEVEPNDDVESFNDLGWIDSAFCVTGLTTCGELSYEDRDYFAFASTVNATVEFSLTWDSPDTDMDADVWIPGELMSLHSLQLGTEFETSTFEIEMGIPYWLFVGCWEGEDGEWTATFQF